MFVEHLEIAGQVLPFALLAGLGGIATALFGPDRGAG